MDNKIIYNLNTQDDHKAGNSQADKVKDLKSAVNKKYLNSKFINKDKDGNYFDSKQVVIKNTKPYSHGLFNDNDLVSKKYVDQGNSKQDVAIADKVNRQRLCGSRKRLARYCYCWSSRQNLCGSRKRQVRYYDCC